jgi:endonuclease/exonuclease/phosphatase family metal-dependent hydrolase
LAVNIVTYNVHLLPGIANGIAGQRSQTGYRASAIAQRLANFDILGLCEVFDRRSARRLLEGLQSRSGDAFHIARGPRRSGRSLVHSGLVLLSRFPIEDTHTVTFKSASRVVTHGIRADGLAAKGVLHCRLRLSEVDSVDCFLTHLESISAKARARQIEQVAAFVNEHASPFNPVIVMGDFNVAADTEPYSDRRDGRSPYRRLRRKLTHNGLRLVDAWDELAMGHVGTSNALLADGGRRLDYIFFSQPDGDGSGRITPREVRALPFVDAKVREGSLSDHLAVACRAEFSAAAEPMWL